LPEDGFIDIRKALGSAAMKALTLPSTAWFQVLPSRILLVARQFDVP
jgi:hypothetical protein